MSYASFQPQLNRGRFDREVLRDIPSSRETRIKKQTTDREKQLRLETRRRRAYQKEIEFQRKLHLEEERKFLLQKRRERIFAASGFLIRKQEQSKTTRPLSVISRQSARGRIQRVPTVVYKRPISPGIPFKTSSLSQVLPPLRQSSSSTSKKSNVNGRSLPPVPVAESNFLRSFRARLDLAENLSKQRFPTPKEFPSMGNNAKENLILVERNIDSRQLDERKKLREIRRREYNNIVKQRKHEAFLRRNEMIQLEQDLQASIENLDKQLRDIKNNDVAETECQLSQVSGKVHNCTLDKRADGVDPSLKGCILEIEQCKENQTNMIN